MTNDFCPQCSSSMGPLPEGEDPDGWYASYGYRYCAVCDVVWMWSDTHGRFVLPVQE